MLFGFGKLIQLCEGGGTRNKEWHTQDLIREINWPLDMVEKVSLISGSNAGGPICTQQGYKNTCGPTYCAAFSKSAVVRVPPAAAAEDPRPPPPPPSVFRRLIFCFFSMVACGKWWPDVWPKQKCDQMCGERIVVKCVGKMNQVGQLGASLKSTCQTVKRHWDTAWSIRSVARFSRKIFWLVGWFCNWPTAQARKL